MDLEDLERGSAMLLSLISLPNIYSGKKWEDVVDTRFLVRNIRESFLCPARSRKNSFTEPWADIGVLGLSGSLINSLGVAEDTGFGTELDSKLRSEGGVSTSSRSTWYMLERSDWCVNSPSDRGSEHSFSGSNSGSEVVGGTAVSRAEGERSCCKSISASLASDSLVRSEAV